MAVRGTRTRAVVVVAATAFSVALAGCTDSSNDDNTGDQAANTQPAVGPHSEESPETSLAVLSSNVGKGGKTVAVDTPVTVSVADGSLESVDLATGNGERTLSGSFNAHKTEWTADDSLEPGTRYVVSARAVDEAGLAKRLHSTFQTDDLTLDEQTYPSVTPLQGETVGVGMPVIVTFDVPVTDRAEFERHMQVTSKPAMVGSWHWFSGNEAHWRPKTYWRPGTQVDVDLDLNSVNAGNGIYGQMDREVSFQIGDAVVMKANLATHSMRVLVNGSLARTIPITGGKPGWESRSGIKLIVEKFRVKRMNAATVGLEPGDPEYYDIPDVEYAQRVTFSGEFLHAAPWSIGDQGSANVSHGCVGMSTENAAWLYGLTHRGDPVDVTGTDRSLENGNGWTDWNTSYADYKTGSAL